MIQTLKGDVESQALGKTLLHEHVFNRFPIGYKEANNIYTLELLQKCKKSGIDTIVDLTPYNNIGYYDEIIEKSPLNIIGCIGFYLERYMSSEIRRMDYDKLLSNTTKKIENGMGKKKYRPAIIKVACSGIGITDSEKKFLKVAAKVSSEYNMPIAVHSPEGVFGHYKYLVDYGANPQKIVMSHSEFNINEDNYEERIKEINDVIKMGGYLLFSKFGTNYTGERAKRTFGFVFDIINQGNIEHLLISSDCNWKWKNGIPRLQNGKNTDYSYAMNYICPGLINMGVNKDDLRIMLENNPQKILEK